MYGIDYLVGSQLVNEFTRCNGRRAFNLMALSLPKVGELESAEQMLARKYRGDES